MSPIKPVQLTIAEENYASNFCEKLIISIRKFDSNLDSDEQVALKLVSFGQSINLLVTHLGYSDPSLIHFYGTSDNGSPMELMQHVSQISFLITSAARKEPNKPKEPIGFRQTENQDNSSE